MPLRVPPIPPSLFPVNTFAVVEKPGYRVCVKTSFWLWVAERPATISPGGA